MNDTELLDLIIDRLENNKGPSQKDIDPFVEYIKRERAEEVLNEKIKKEVARQLKKA